MIDDAELERQRRARDAATISIVTSSHPLRVVVAGPGTGKTYAFKEALDRVGGGVALTFLRTLADDLAVGLAGTADASTFHRFAKHLVHQLSPVGLTKGFSLYPPLLQLEATDLAVLGEASISDRDLEKAIQDVDLGPLPKRVLDLGSYYDAAAFVDIVYRVYLHLGTNPDEIPTYPLIVVDEYQDFSLLESRFIEKLGAKSPLLIAGDDDQALYDFRHASADYIRDLAGSKVAEVHELPYCGRCTEIVVAAVNTTIARATASGHFKGRLKKPFECYLPDKAKDSAEHPRLIHAHCSTFEMISKYVEVELGRISASDVDSSRASGHYTALVVGRGHFVEPVHRWLVEHGYPQAEMRPRSPGIQPIDAYRRLAMDTDSNLGWRILVHLDRFKGWERSVAEALTSGRPLARYLPDEYRARHLPIAKIARRVVDQEQVEDPDLRRLASVLGLAPDAMFEAFGLSHARDEDVVLPEEDDEEATTAAPGRPSILCTTLNGAKGLSAEHVFVVGCVDGVFPKAASSPTDHEISQFIVALSRTRKACHLVSCKVFWPNRNLQPSLFLRWVEPHADRREVSADLFKRPKVPRSGR